VDTLWLDNLEWLEAISQNEEARRILLRLAALSQSGLTPSFVVEVALDQDLDATTKGRLVELAQDESFLLAVEEYLARTTACTRSDCGAWAILDSNQGPPPYQSGALTS
jgi:hypothetical protein